MSRPARITGYTLVELLVVMVIFGIIMLLSSGMSSRARDTFVAQQQIKNYVQNARIIRRKSMLITRNSSDKEWVHGIGIRFEKSQGQWMMTQFKALKKVAGNQFFYMSYPKVNQCIEPEWISSTVCAENPNEMTLRRIEGTVSQYLPANMELEIQNTGTSGPTTLNCTNSLTVIYESINGEMHAYCNEQTVTQTLNMSIRIKYQQGGSYRYKLNLKSNGEINAAL